MKDALGHGSGDRGGAAQPPVAAHAAAVNALPGKSDNMISGVSDATYHAAMPAANFAGGVKDLLGLWSGSQKPEPLTDTEQAQCDQAYAQRGDWREVARNIQDQRRGHTS